MWKKRIKFGGKIICLIYIGRYLFSFLLVKEKYYLFSLVILFTLLILFFLIYEKRTAIRELLFVATLSSISVIARISLFFLPQAKPIAAMTVISGCTLGMLPGFATGALTMFLSNFYFGQGMYTPYQMVAMGMVGLLAGVCSKKNNMGKITISIIGAIMVVVIYGGIVDVNTVLMTNSTPDISFILGIYLAALPMNLIHGISTAVFLFVLYNPIREKIIRLRIKFGLSIKSDIG